MPGYRVKLGNSRFSRGYDVSHGLAGSGLRVGDLYYRARRQGIGILSGERQLKELFWPQFIYVNYVSCHPGLRGIPTRRLRPDTIPVCASPHVGLTAVPGVRARTTPGVKVTGTGEATSGGMNGAGFVDLNFNHGRTG